MADIERELPFQFIDKRYDQRTAAGSVPGTQHSTLNYNDVTSLRARLTTINAGYYTAAKLNNMTKNDMVYAVRLNDDSGGI